MDINMTLFGQTFAMIVFVWFTMKFVWPLIDVAITERQEKIAEGLAAAERGSQDMELAKEKASELLREAKQQASEIVDQANKRHAEVVDSAKGDAKVEADKIIASAMAELDQELNRAKDELRTKLSSLAVSGAEQILERSIGDKDHQDMLAKLAEQI